MAEYKCTRSKYLNLYKQGKTVIKSSKKNGYDKEW